MVSEGVKPSHELDFHTRSFGDLLKLLNLCLENNLKSWDDPLHSGRWWVQFNPGCRGFFRKDSQTAPRSLHSLKDCLPTGKLT